MPTSKFDHTTLKLSKAEVNVCVNGILSISILNRSKISLKVNLSNVIASGEEILTYLFVNIAVKKRFNLFRNMNKTFSKFLVTDGKRDVQIQLK